MVSLSVSRGFRSHTCFSEQPQQLRGHLGGQGSGLAALTRRCLSPAGASAAGDAVRRQQEPQQG